MVPTAREVVLQVIGVGWGLVLVCYVSVIFKLLSCSL